MYQANKEEAAAIKKIAGTYYMKPALSLIQKDIKASTNKKEAWQTLFNKLYQILTDSKKQVDKQLQNRIKAGEIRDASQARKSIAGNAFSNLVVYAFIHNKLIGNIRPDIYITSRKSTIKNFDDIATIRVGNETQKPDMDLVVYTKKKNDEIDRCIILSLKTSLRERAGQTYKWKLLMEIATTKNPIKNKYKIEYNPKNKPLVCFVTVNFYDEINSPQHRGMFQFFDNSFIGKPLNTDFIRSLSHIVEYANESL